MKSRRQTPASTIKRTSELLKQSKDTLATFLAIEIETGLTFVELAENRNVRIETERRIRLVNNAQVAAGVVRRLKDRLDADQRKQIESRLGELERAILSL